MAGLRVRSVLLLAAVSFHLHSIQSLIDCGRNVRRTQVRNPLRLKNRKGALKQVFSAPVQYRSSLYLRTL